MSKFNQLNLPFAPEDIARLIGPLFWVVSVLVAAIFATPGGFSNLAPDSNGQSSLGRALFSSTAPATNTRAVTVNQGDRLSISYPGTNKLQFCTLGYIDHKNNIGYTSAHCVPGTDRDEEARYPGGGMTITTRSQTVVGHVYPSMAYVEDGNRTANDVAVIKFSDNVTLGKNSFSGDKIASRSDLNPETDELCLFGATTKTVYCAQPRNESYINDDVVGFTARGETHGDSGSGIYIRSADGESKGVLGLYSGTYRNDDPVSVGPMIDKTDRFRFEVDI